MHSRLATISLLISSLGACNDPFGPGGFERRKPDGFAGVTAFPPQAPSEKAGDRES